MNIQQVMMKRSKIIRDRKSSNAIAMFLLNVLKRMSRMPWYFMMLAPWFVFVVPLSPAIQRDVYDVIGFLVGKTNRADLTEVDTIVAMGTALLIINILLELFLKFKGEQLKTISLRTSVFMKAIFSTLGYVVFIVYALWHAYPAHEILAVGALMLVWPFFFWVEYETRKLIHTAIQQVRT